MIPKKRSRAAVGESEQTQQGQAVVDLTDNSEVEVNGHVQAERCVNHQQAQLINPYATFLDVQNKETSDGELQICRLLEPGTPDGRFLKS